MVNGDCFFFYNKLRRLTMFYSIIGVDVPVEETALLSVATESSDSVSCCTFNV